MTRIIAYHCPACEYEIDPKDYDKKPCEDCGRKLQPIHPWEPDDREDGRCGALMDNIGESPDY